MDGPQIPQKKDENPASTESENKTENVPTIRLRSPVRQYGLPPWMPTGHIGQLPPDRPDGITTGHENRMKTDDAEAFPLGCFTTIILLSVVISIILAAYEFSIPVALASLIILSGIILRKGGRSSSILYAQVVLVILFFLAIYVIQRAMLHGVAPWRY